MSENKPVLTVQAIVDFKKDTIDLAEIISRHIGFVSFDSINKDIKLLCRSLADACEKANKDKRFRIKVPGDTPAVTKPKKFFNNILDKTFRGFKQPEYAIEDISEDICEMCLKIKEVEEEEILITPPISELINWVENEFDHNTSQRATVRKVLTSIKNMMIHSGIKLGKFDSYLWGLIDRFPYAGLFLLGYKFLSDTMNNGNDYLSICLDNIHYLLLNEIIKSSAILDVKNDDSVMLEHILSGASVYFDGYDDFLSIDRILSITDKTDANIHIVNVYNVYMLYALFGYTHYNGIFSLSNANHSYYTELRMDEMVSLLLRTNNINDVFKQSRKGA